MLAQARKNLSVRGIEATLVKADFRELDRHFSDWFDAVVCLSTSLPHLLAESEVLEMLENTRKVLRPEGLLVITQAITDKLVRDKPFFIPVITRHNFSRIFGVEYGIQTLKFHVLDLVHTAGRQQSTEYCFEYQIVLRDDYQRLLEATGYQSIEFFSDYGRTPYDKETSDRMIVVASG